MQVSWIDPQDVAALAEALLRPPPKPGAATPNEPGPKHTEAVLAELVHKDDFVFTETDQDDHAFRDVRAHELNGEVTAAFAEEPFHEEHYFEPEETFSDEPPMPFEEGPMPDLAAFRERLQAIRERAIGAGLLPSVVLSATANTDLAPELHVEKPFEVDAEMPVEDESETWAFDSPTGTFDERLEAFASWAYRHIGAGEVLVVDDHGDLLWGRHARPELILSTIMARNAATRASPLSACGILDTIHHKLASGHTLTVIPCDTRLGMIQVAISAAEGLREKETRQFRRALIAAMDA